MHKARMTEILAKELAFQLYDINNHNFGLLLPKLNLMNLKMKLANSKMKLIKIFKIFVLEFKNEIEKMVTKIKFNEKIKNLELAIIIKLGFIMVSGISILGLLIKM
jgi:hypothetical protein